jgi:hypothetical protein
MIVKLCLSLLVSLSLGYILANTFLPFNRRGYSDFILKSSLAVGLGFGSTSCIYFLCLVLLGPGINGVIILEAGLLTLLIVMFIYAKVSNLIWIRYDMRKTIHDLKLNRIIMLGFSLFLSWLLLTLFMRQYSCHMEFGMPG